MAVDALQQLVEMRGIESNFIDAWGQPTEISDSSKMKLLNSLGYDTSSDSIISEQINAEAEEYWLSMLNPVLVVTDNSAIKLPFRCAIDKANNKFSLKLSIEDGTERKFFFTPVDDGQLVNVSEIEGIEYQEYLIDLPSGLPFGYHSITISKYRTKKIQAESKLIVAPNRCYIADEIDKGKKCWGLSIQLYCLKSKKNWGIGDFGDLNFLVEHASSLGADYIGLNPIHALYPDNPDACSPYGPSSRRWLNFLYIDVTALPCYDDDSVQAIVNSEAFKQKLSALQSVDQVDYVGVTELKLSVLKTLFTAFQLKYLSEKSQVNYEFLAFIDKGGKSLTLSCTYDALMAWLSEQGNSCWGWPVFPEEYKNYDSEAVQAFSESHTESILFFKFLQWQASKQLDYAHQLAISKGMQIGLYRDLAVGVSEGSAEIWGNKDLYCINASVGAPPDVLGPLGQNWGLPPMDPMKLYQQAYQPIIDLFSSNMASSGALRIDHVMGLLRLWWVTKGEDAKEGGYIYYPVEDLLAILALESHRHKSMVIGEDLGTVPEEIRTLLSECGIYSYRVFFFEQANDGGFYSPKHYPIQSMATLTTHDMPTLIGFWHCLDLELGKTLGLYNDQVLPDLYNQRHRSKQAILDTLHGHGSICNHLGVDVNTTAMCKELNHGIHLHMATGSSALLSFQLEDWLQMTDPVNVPGTSVEYPNWKRKLSTDLEDILEEPSIRELAMQISERRKVE